MLPKDTKGLKFNANDLDMGTIRLPSQCQRAGDYGLTMINRSFAILELRVGSQADIHLGTPL